jgi:hypothetical protein
MYLVIDLGHHATADGWKGAPFQSSFSSLVDGEKVADATLDDVD